MHRPGTTQPLLLVTGGSGLLGANLILEALDAGWRVAAVNRGSPVRADGVQGIRADLLEQGTARELVGRLQPDAVINTAAATNVDACESGPELATCANTWLPGELAAATSSMGARLIHISTDAVFDGRSFKPYGEDAEPGPLSVYGRTKLDGEQAVLTAQPDALVVRTTIYGWNAQAKQSLAEWFLAGMRRGMSVPGFEDVWMTPILVNDLAGHLLDLARLPVHGILHVAGRDCVTKADFGRRIAREFELEPDLVRSTSIETASLGSPRARRPCLAVARAEVILGRHMPTTDEGIVRFRQLEESGLPQRLRGLLEEPT